jgi:uncharacterized protein YdeI (YjbR/CyaY-like superfamily)
MQKATNADEFFQNACLWRDELLSLRKLILAAGLKEGVKWGGPCYTHEGANVVGLGAFKSYFGLWFFQGALLLDDDRVLINAQEGKTKAQRQWRMTSAKEIRPALVKQYVREAKALAAAGTKIAPDRGRVVRIPAELKAAFVADKSAAKAFNELSLSCRREYADYVSDAKQEATRRRRVEKILPMIRTKMGLNDKYRKP